MHTLFPRTSPTRGMKGALAALLVAGVIGAPSIGAQTLQRATSQAGISTKRGLALEPTSSAIRPGHLVNASAAPAELQYHVFDSLFNAFSYYSGDAEPVWWDQYSNTLVTIKRGFTGSSDNIYVRSSTDMGLTWSQPYGPLHETSIAMGRYPSILVINKDKSADRSNLLYYFTFPGLVGEDFGSFFQGFLDGNFQLLSPPDLNTGVTDGSTTLKWSTGSKSVATNDGMAVVTAGELSGNNLGIRRFDLSTGNLTAFVPPAWASGNFSDPGSADSRTSLNIGLGHDNAGTLYAGIYSRFPANETSRRLHPYPGVSTSTDGGLTWSTIETLPIDVIRAYAESQGALADSVIFPYNTAQDFSVSADGKISFALNFFESNTDKDDGETINQVVEVTKDGSTWTMHKIADISGRNFTFNPISPSTDRENQMGNELQLARTADGSALVAKWVDVLSYEFDRDVNADGESPDTVTTSDVFVAIRKMGSNEWSEPMNVTESPIIDRITWIPDVVPSDLKNVPLITLQAKLDPTDPSSQADKWTSLQLDAEAEQYVTSQTFDVSALAGVEAPVVAGASGAMLGAAYPNPAVAEASIAYTLPVSGDVTLDVWNSAGQKVATLVSGRVEAGEHVAKVGASALPAGAYIYRLRFNGATASRIFTVVH